MNKQTVFLLAKIEDELPKEKGEYLVCSMNLTTKNESIDSLRFNGNKFIDISNWKHLYWLKPTEAHVFTSEELKQLLEDYTNRIVDNGKCLHTGYGGYAINKKSITSQLPLFLKEIGYE
jgi:hypothetical protein